MIKISGKCFVQGWVVKDVFLLSYFCDLFQGWGAVVFISMKCM